MNKKGLPLIITVGIAAAIFSYVLAGMIFKSTPRNTKVPQVEAIKASFPDTKNDSAYSSFLNSTALDPTQTVQIGGSQNNNPF